MTPSIKARWIEALRSGRYKQGHNYLRNLNDEFCCLGVLCDVVKDDVLGRWDETPKQGLLPSSRFLGFFTPDQESYAYPPVSVEDFAAIETPVKPVGTSVTTHLAAMNDEYQASFAEIADWIEENL